MTTTDILIRIKTAGTETFDHGRVKPDLRVEELERIIWRKYNEYDLLMLVIGGKESAYYKGKTIGSFNKPTVVVTVSGNFVGGKLTVKEIKN